MPMRPDISLRALKELRMSLEPPPTPLLLIVVVGVPIPPAEEREVAEAVLSLLLPRAATSRKNCGRVEDAG